MERTSKIDLNPDEFIEKEILPEKRFFFNSAEQIRIPFSILFLIFSIVMFFKFFIFLSIIFFIAGLYFAFGRWILKYFDLKDTFYLITNQRVIIVRKNNYEILKQWKFQDFKSVHIEINKNNFGNIIFGMPESPFPPLETWGDFLGNNGMNFKEDEFSMQSISNIHKILPILEKHNLKISKSYY